MARWRCSGVQLSQRVEFDCVTAAEAAGRQLGDWRPSLRFSIVLAFVSGVALSQVALALALRSSVVQTFAMTLACCCLRAGVQMRLACSRILSVARCCAPVSLSSALFSFWVPQAMFV